MTRQLTIVRAAHLLDYLDVMRGYGAPVDRDLACSRLPPTIEETPDHYISVPAAIGWVGACGHDVEPMELGLRAAQNASLASLRSKHQAAIIGAQTGFTRLKTLLHIARIEDSGFRSTILQEGDQLRVCCDVEGLKAHPFICFAEWLNIQAVISVVRSVAGPTWCPREICFVSPYRVPAAVQSAFPNTRILVGQSNTSVLMDRVYLARTTGEAKPDPDALSDLLLSDYDIEQPVGDYTFASLLKQIIQPYLNGGRPDLALTAEMAGMSKRTLQRKLQQNDLSFSEVLRQARFDLARTLLDDPDIKIIDVAMTSGYENPQHFTRAFRRVTGVTPTIYRRDLAKLGDAQACALAS